MQEGLLPIPTVPQYTVVDTVQSGWQAGSATNIKLKTAYLDIATLPRDQRRYGYPNDLMIVFSNTIQDTSLDADLPSVMTKFRIYAMTDTGMTKVRYQFRDVDGNGTLSTPAERIDVVCYPYNSPNFDNAKVWRITIDTTGWAANPPASERWNFAMSRRMLW